MISHSELVEELFGYWPEFADAKVVELSWRQSSALHLALHYIDAEQSKGATVGLLFQGVTDLQLSELGTENVLDLLAIVPGQPIVVELVPCFGLGGTFKCSSVEVTGVAPNNSSKPTPLRGAA